MNQLVLYVSQSINHLGCILVLGCVVFYSAFANSSTTLAKDLPLHFSVCTQSQSVKPSSLKVIQEELVLALRKASQKKWIINTQNDSYLINADSDATLVKNCKMKNEHWMNMEIQGDELRLNSEISENENFYLIRFEWAKIQNSSKTIQKFPSTFEIDKTELKAGIWQVAQILAEQLEYPFVKKEPYFYSSEAQKSDSIKNEKVSQAEARKEYKEELRKQNNEDFEAYEADFHILMSTNLGYVTVSDAVASQRLGLVFNGWQAGVSLGIFSFLFAVSDNISVSPTIDVGYGFKRSSWHLAYSQMINKLKKDNDSYEQYDQYNQYKEYEHYHFIAFYYQYDFGRLLNWSFKVGLGANIMNTDRENHFQLSPKGRLVADHEVSPTASMTYSFELWK